LCTAKGKEREKKFSKKILIWSDGCTVEGKERENPRKKNSRINSDMEQRMYRRGKKKGKFATQKKSGQCKERRMYCEKEKK